MGVKIGELLTVDGVTHYSWMFTCPSCQCSHQFTNIWKFNGNKEKPTISPSIKVTWPELNDQGKKIDHICHSYVTDGRIQFLPDSTHSLKGQTVELPDWDETKI